MSTPFATFANANVVFKVRSGVPDYNEYGHLVDDLVDYPITCFLEQKKKPSDELSNDSNQEEIYVEGRCISPKTLSPDIQSQSLGDATLNGVTYKFRYVASLSSAFYNENDILGQKIQGYLSRNTLWGGDNG